MSEARNLIRRLGNQPLRVRARQGANLAIAACFGRPLGLIHVVEYPKCGGSWVRNMLADYVGLPRFLDDRLLRRGDVVQVHRLPKPWYRKTVVVTRDPRDMYVSTYYHETHYRNREQRLLIERWFHHEPDRPLRENFARYLEAKLTNFTHPPFMLHEFVQAWKRRPEALWVRYEDCLTNAEAELTRIVEGLGLSLDRERVRQAVEANSFENATRARGKARQRGEADAGAFERKGIAGDWRNHFDAHSCEVLERYEGESLRALGYESDGDWASRWLSERSAVPD